LKLASKSPLTLAIGKEAFYKQAELPLSRAYDYTAKSWRKIFGRRTRRKA